MDAAPDTDRLERLAAIFRTLSDPARLRILGALAERPRTGSELSALLGLSAPTISHHMAKLNDAGLVTTTADAQRRIYALDLGVLQGLARASSESRQPATPPDEADPERAKTLRDFIVDGRLKQIPAQRRKRVFVLQHLVEGFTPGQRYSEKQVNEQLKLAHEDFATLRRELVDYGFMTRDKGMYEVANSLPSRGPTVAQEMPADEHDWLRRLVDRALDDATPARNGR